MSSVSRRFLKVLAALTWFTGGVILLLKGVGLVLEVRALEQSPAWTWVVVLTGLMVGVIKGRSIFERSCRDNLARIDALARPRPWLFFKPKFFVALLAMITAGVVLTRVSRGHYPLLLGVTALDVAMAAALLVSGRVYWTK